MEIEYLSMRVINGSRVRIPHWQATVMRASLEARQSGDELSLRWKNLLAVEFHINEEKVRTAYRASQLQRLVCLPIGTFQTVDRAHNDMHRIQKH